MKKISETTLYSGLAALAVLIALVQLNRTPLPWIDEALLASTSLSANGAPAVLASFPHTGKFTWFYGPAGFFFGRISFSLFGVSMWSWRILCWISATLIVLGSAWLVHIITRSRPYAALAAALVALSPSLGQRFSSGRFDAFTVACEILALCFLIRGGGWWNSGVAGLLLAGAVLSTPRAQPFVLGLSLAICGRAVLKRQSDLLKRLCVAGITAGAVVSAWTFSVGLNPWSWFRFLLSVSSGDRNNSSPLLHGSWGLEAISLQGLVVPLCLALWLGLMFFRRTRGQRIDDRSAVILAAALLNAVLTALLISRLFAYEIFWDIPLITAFVAAAASYEPEPRLFRSWMSSAAAIMLVASLGVRVAKVSEVFMSWRARDPAPIKNFVCQHVPPSSTVYGTREFYFYAVEGCGSTYLFTQEWIAEGLNSRAGQPVYTPGAFVIWPMGVPVDVKANLKEVARFTPQSHAFSEARASHIGIMTSVTRFAGGYPETVLYQIQ